MAQSKHTLIIINGKKLSHKNNNLVKIGFAKESDSIFT